MERAATRTAAQVPGTDAAAGVNATAPRMTAPRRREGILRAATKVFSRVGFHGATISMIAAEAGCSEPMLYKHFADKRELLLACLVETEARVEREIDRILKHGDPLPGFAAFVDCSRDYPDMLMLRMLCCTLSDDPEVMEHLRGGVDRLMSRVHHGIAQGQAAGLVREGVEPETVGWTWLGVSLAACYSRALGGDEQFREVMQVGKRYISSLRTPDAKA